MKLKTPFAKRSLTATKNILSFVRSSMHYAQSSNTNVQWSGGVDGFGLSIVFQFNTIPLHATILVFRESGLPTTGQGYYLIAEQIDANTALVYFEVVTASGTYTTYKYTVEKGRLNRFSFAYELPSIDNSFETTLLSKLNDQQMIRSSYAISDIGSISTLGTLYFGRNAEDLSTDTNIDGYITNAVFFNDFVTEYDLKFLHINNIPSDNISDRVSAYYSFNQDHGDIVFDCVCQYNYAKSTQLSCNHASLQNYSNDEVGIGMDPLDQSSYIYLYDKTVPAIPSFKNALKFIGTDAHFLNIPSFAPTNENGYTYIVGFCLDSDRDFANDYIIAKRHTGNTIAKLLFGSGSKVLGFLNYNPPASDSGICNNNFNNYDTSKPLFFCGSETMFSSDGKPFGFYQATIATNPLAWNDVNTDDLYIGGDDQVTAAGGGRYLTGYLFHVSIYKEVLSKKDIFDIVNNGLGLDNPRVRQSCELYLNFEEILVSGSVYTLKDWSPQNRVVTLNNYTINDVTPGDPDYKLFDLDSLR